MPRYRVEVADARAHLWRVTLTLTRPAPAQRFSLPVWVPGSYMVRDFSRHLSALQAEQGGQPVALEQVDKTTWLAHCNGHGALTLRYLVYAFDPSVRGAWLSPERGFFNPGSLCLRAEGREAEAHLLQLAGLPARWGVATAMSAGRGGRAYVAADYAELLDHPFELGHFWRGDFRVGGTDFSLVVTGAWPSLDKDRLVTDLRRVCAATLALWHGRGKPAFERYLFLLHAGEQGHGGLEHRASTALSCARRDLPRTGETERSDAYVSLLGLAGHELFHAWNVKRLRPREFEALDLARENYTALLWFFEGVTSYYEDLLLLRGGVIDAPAWLRLLARHVDAVASTPGRRTQSVAQASFDAWVKYYRSDENTANATVNYYAKGALVALALDLSLRAHGGSLDEVMRLLWQRCATSGVSEGDIAQALQDVAGRGLDAELQAWVHGTDELPLQPLLEAAGIVWRSEPAGLAQRLGLRRSEGALSGVHVKTVLRGSPAEAAGLAAGDELLAVDGWRLRRFDDARQWLAPGAAFDVLLVRDQRVLTCRVQPAGDAAPSVTLTLATQGSPLRQAWLGA